MVRATSAGYQTDPAFHRATTTLLGSKPGQYTGRVWHRQAIDLCFDHLDIAVAGICGDRKPPFLPTDTGRVKEWIPLLGEFWKPFIERVKDKLENVSKDEAIQARELGTDEASGKPITVRIGQYGAFVQFGIRDNEEKPKFAGLRPGQHMNTITLEEAIHLFDLPRELGESAEVEKITAKSVALASTSSTTPSSFH